MNKELMKINKRLERAESYYQKTYKSKERKLKEPKGKVYAYGKWF